MKEKGEAILLILTFLPVIFAIASMIIQYETLDLFYLLALFIVGVRYYIEKKKE